MLINHVIHKVLVVVLESARALFLALCLLGLVALWQRNCHRPERPPLIPRILHQSWKNRSLPRRFAYWRGSWLRQLPPPRWQHVRWTDEDNRRLVLREYPQYYAYYAKLPKNIYRADFVSEHWSPR